MYKVSVMRYINSFSGTIATIYKEPPFFVLRRFISFASSPFYAGHTQKKYYLLLLNISNQITQIK